MKAILIAAVLAALSLCKVYPETLIITEINRESDTLVAKTFIGFEYVLKGIEDYEVNDGISAIMFNNFTANVSDDVIIEAKYAAWRLEDWQ